MLEVVGGDCAGALSLYPQGKEPDIPGTGFVEVLDDIKLQEILKLIKRRPMLAGDDGYRHYFIVKKNLNSHLLMTY